MNSIVELVSDKNKEWVSKLDIKDVANMIESFALLPDMVHTFPNSAFVLPDDQGVSLTYSNTPALKGLQGESEFEDMCENLLSSQFKIINTAKQSKSGDFFIEWTSPETGCLYRYLIDVKNYRSTVPSKEVEKFYRDIELHPTIHGAIMISLHSQIVGRKSVFQYEERLVGSTSIPIAYVCSNEPTVIIEIIRFMCSLSDIRRTCGIKFTSSEKVMTSIKELEESIDMFSRSRSNLQDIKLMIEKQFNKIFIDLLSVEHIFKTKIQNITSSLLEDAEECTTAINLPPALVVTKYNRVANISQESLGDIKPKKKNIVIEEKKEVHVPESPDIIVSLNRDCGNYTSSETIDNMLRHIWSGGDWDTGKISSAENEWKVSRNCGQTSIIFKFMKKHITYTVPNVKILTEKKIGKITRKGFTAKLNADSYGVLCAMCDIPL
jgi:hypothetical protein